MEKNSTEPPESYPRILPIRVKLLFFVNLMVLGNGQLSYLIIKNHPFFIGNDRFSTVFLLKVVQIIYIVTFCRFVQPKISFITFGKLISTKMSGENSEIEEKFPVEIFVAVDG